MPWCNQLCRAAAADNTHSSIRRYSRQRMGHLQLGRHSGLGYWGSGHPVAARADRCGCGPQAGGGNFPGHGTHPRTRHGLHSAGISGLTAWAYGLWAFAVADSVFSTIKNEKSHHKAFIERISARAAITEYIESQHHRKRRQMQLICFWNGFCGRSGVDAKRKNQRSHLNNANSSSR